MSTNFADDLAAKIEEARGKEAREVADAIKALTDEVRGLKEGIRVTPEQAARLEAAVAGIDSIFTPAQPEGAGGGGGGGTGGTEGGTSGA